jgi:hypothetical protein
MSTPYWLILEHAKSSRSLIKLSSTVITKNRSGSCPERFFFARYDQIERCAIRLRSTGARTLYDPAGRSARRRRPSLLRYPAETADIRLRPSAIESYLRDLAQLETALSADLADGEGKAAKAFRAMIETVTIVPTPAGSTPGILVHCVLDSLLNPPSFTEGPTGGGRTGAG